MLLGSLACAFSFLALGVRADQGKGEKEEEKVEIFKPETHPELEFSPCDLAQKIDLWNHVDHDQLIHVRYPGFWTCLAMYNSASWDERKGFVAHNCLRKSAKEGGLRCKDELYGIFNLKSEFFCDHKHFLEEPKKEKLNGQLHVRASLWVVGIVNLYTFFL